MNENELKVAIDQLTAIGDFALDLRVKLTAMLEAPTTNDEIKQEVIKAIEAHVKKMSQKVTVDEPEIIEAVMPVALVTSSPAILADVKVDLKAIADKYELGDMKIGEVRDYLTGYDIEFPAKAKKPELITILCQSIADGLIPLDDEDEDTVDTIVDEVQADEIVESDLEDSNYDASDERVSTENEVEDKIRSTYPKKLKISAIKKFLKTYYDGDAEMADLDDQDDDVLVDMYIAIQQALVDDEGEIQAMEEAYFRNDLIFCCGKATVEMADSKNIYCEVCGNEYAGD